METILIILTIVVSFKVGYDLGKDKEIKIPKIEKKEVISKKNVEIDNKTQKILDNIDNYNGTSEGQVDI